MNVCTYVVAHQATVVHCRQSRLTKQVQLNELSSFIFFLLFAFSVMRIEILPSSPVHTFMRFFLCMHYAVVITLGHYIHIRPFPAKWICALRFAVFLVKSMGHKSDCYILTKNIKFSFYYFSDADSDAAIQPGISDHHPSGSSSTSSLSAR